MRPVIVLPDESIRPSYELIKSRDLRATFLRELIAPTSLGFFKSALPFLSISAKPL